MHLLRPEPSVTAAVSGHGRACAGSQTCTRERKVGTFNIVRVIGLGPCHVKRWPTTWQVSIKHAHGGSDGSFRLSRRLVTAGPETREHCPDESLCPTQSRKPPFKYIMHAGLGPCHVKRWLQPTTWSSRRIEAFGRSHTVENVTNIDKPATQCILIRYHHCVLSIWTSRITFLMKSMVTM